MLDVDSCLLIVCESLTISYDAEYREINVAFPVGSFLQGDPVTCGGEDVTAANGNQLTAIITTGHIIQHCSVVDKSVKLSAREDHTLGLI